MHERGTITEEQREEMRARMLGAIFPNVPRTEAEQAAFDRAVDYQIWHDQEQQTDLPRGAKSVRIGHYSVEMRDDAEGDRLTARRLCGAAYGALLYAGLLYKGVERI
ncbi:MAG: hypothetical protein IJ088_13345 [Clostridia bacterium]|nr:hypothetical protein [Clostridia bacterium]